MTPFNHLFTHSFRKYLLNTNYIPATGDSKIKTYKACLLKKSSHSDRRYSHRSSDVQSSRKALQLCEMGGSRKENSKCFSREGFRKEVSLGC
jgi:hypothetical protein